MTAVSVVEEGRALALPEEQLIDVLASSLYPGAKRESVSMVLAYCRAAGLDPMQKPVHIVPMSVKTGQKDSKGYDVTEMRDVIMPGIGLYRVQAARTGQLLGIDEPVFSGEIPMPGVEGHWVPESCSVTVHRLVGGQRASFTCREFWLENYATARRDSIVPNPMWKRRARAQLAKCAEAQALRRAFPEVGTQPTDDETLVDLDTPPAVGGSGPLVVAKKHGAALPLVEEVPTGAEHQSAPIGTPETRPDAPPPPPPPATPAPPPAARNTAPPAAAGAEICGAGEIAYLRVKAKAAGVDLDQVLRDMGGLVAEKLSRADFLQVRQLILSRLQ